MPEKITAICCFCVTFTASLPPSRGTARIWGHDVVNEALAVRRLVGLVSDETSESQSDWTAREYLGYFARVRGLPNAEQAVETCLNSVGLDTNFRGKLIGTYSTGMKRKLGLIQALQTDPPLLILDEPTEGLDPLVQGALHELLFELPGRGRTVFMSSHVLSEVERLCDRIGVIRHGEMVLLSTVEEARRISGRTVQIQFAGPVEAMALPAGMQLVSQTPDRWTVKVEHEVGALLPILAHLPVRDLEIIEPALEDVLRSFYRPDEP
jgi:ABC-2 type transport system ATP-binding protein